MRILVIGAGFSGAVIAHQMHKAGHDVLVIDERDHIGGNAYDYTNEHGIRVHKYGPHLFHTNNKTVYDWITQFGEWVPYQHKAKAILKDGTYVPFPANKETLDVIGKDNIIDTIFRPYTRKMWGKELEELDPSVIKRVPVKEDDNDLYFPNDEYQILPKDGYTAVFEQILDGIEVKLKIKFNSWMEDSYDHIFNSMPIDVYFKLQRGPLPYRSIKFHTVNLPLPKVLPATTVNFTHDGPYTRVTEWKNMPEHGTNDAYTTVTYEEPCDYTQNNLERYYPVKDIDGLNRKTYEQYKAMVADNMTFIGRCGMYVYIDMHQAINSALNTANKFLEKNNG